MSLDITKFNDDEIYLDTMIFYLFLRGADPNAKEFFKRIQKQEFIAYTSVLTFDELSYRMLLAAIRDKYSGSPLEHLRQDESKMIAEFYPSLRPNIERLQAISALTLRNGNFISCAFRLYRRLPICGSHTDKQSVVHDNKRARYLRPIPY